MKMYKTGRFNELIEEIEITRKTDKTVWFMNSRGRETREQISSSYRNYFETLEEAKSYLKAKFTRKISFAKSTISDYENKIKELDKY